MAKYIAIVVSLIFLVFSVNFVAPEEKTEDPSVEIIKQQDAEEGYNFQYVQESLVCEDPKRDSNVVTKISGDPPHMSSNVKVTCDAGTHFIGLSENRTMVTVTCSPLPHPCMCMAAWQTLDDYQLMYDFNCTSDIEDDIDQKPDSTKDEFPIYPLQEKDDPQCPDPTPVRGTMKILHGHPYSYGCNVLLTCDPGLVFEDGKSVWNLTCLGLSVLPPKCAWVPMHDGRPICKDDHQCPDPSPVRGTVKVLYGKPYMDGCKVSLVCDPGLVFSDGKAVWNLTCTPVAHIPPVFFWIPQYDGRPTCTEPEISDTNEEVTESETDEPTTENENKEVLDEATANEEEQMAPSEDVASNDDPQCPDPTPVRGTMKILHGHPFSFGCNVLLTCDPGLVFDDGKSVWNLTCLAIPVNPPAVVWVPANKGKPVCREPSNTEVTETETNTAVEETPDNQINARYETGDSRENLDTANNVEIDNFDPEEDLDGTFHENYIEATDNEETNIDNNDDIILTSELEEHEEFTNNIGDSVNLANTLENPNNERLVKEELINKNEDYEDQTGKETEETGTEFEQHTSLDETLETENISEEDEHGLTNNDGETSESETLLEENEGKVGENAVEENEDIESSDEELSEIGWNEISESENGEQTLNEEGDDIENKEEMQEEEESEERENENTEQETEEEEYEPEYTQENDEIETDTENFSTENDSEQTIEDVEEKEEEEEEEEEEEGEEENTEKANDLTNTNENEHFETVEGEENEEYDEEHGIVLDDVYPLQPPAIKEPSVIFAAIKESYKEENEDGIEETNNDRQIFDEVEPPGYLQDIQMMPVEASKEEIQTNEDNCSLPAETGPCRAYFRQYFFNSKTKECDVFVYGGCKGNGNNFKTLGDCENTCVNRKVNL